MTPKTQKELLMERDDCIELCVRALNHFKAHSGWPADFMKVISSAVDYVEPSAFVIHEILAEHYVNNVHGREAETGSAVKTQTEDVEDDPGIKKPSSRDLRRVGAALYLLGKTDMADEVFGWSIKAARDLETPSQPEPQNIVVAIYHRGQYEAGSMHHNRLGNPFANPQEAEECFHVYRRTRNDCWVLEKAEVIDADTGRVLRKIDLGAKENNQ